MMKVIVISMIGTILGVYLKSFKSEFSIYVVLACIVLIVFYSVTKIKLLLNYIKFFENLISINNGFLKILIKIAGISYISEMTKSICKDYGNTSLSLQVEIFSRLSIILLSIPIIVALIETINLCFVS